MKSVEEFMKSKNLKIEKIEDIQEIGEKENVEESKVYGERYIKIGNIKEEKLKALEELDKAKTRVLKYIAYKKRTENEVRTKFRGQIEDEMLEEIIEYLIQAHYLNDYEFIQKQINEYMNLKTMSIKEIKYKLYAKGLDRKLVEKYIEENREMLEEYEAKCVEKIRRKKASTMEEQEINQFLFRKGYHVNIRN